MTICATCAIDNGVTGAIAVKEGEDFFFYLAIEWYTYKALNYTKRKGYSTHIDMYKLKELLKRHNVTRVLLERPMINPQRWRATVSAIRADESMFQTIRLCGVAIEYIDSKEWQKRIFPEGAITGETKKLSKEIGFRLFPQFKRSICKQDADALLMLWYILRFTGGY